MAGVAKHRPLPVTAIRALLFTGRSECDDPWCRGWDVFMSGRGLEIQRCDTCCPDALDDADLARLPEAQEALEATRTIMDRPTCPTDGSPLRMCRDRDPACMHCDVCDWVGDPSMGVCRPGRATRRAYGEGLVERAIADAERHGRESDDPDHEVGDLQTIVRLLARQLGPQQICIAMLEWTPWHSD